MNGLVAAGLVEVALGAVLGFPYALTLEGSQASKRLMAALRINHRGGSGSFTWTSSSWASCSSLPGRRCPTYH